MRLQDKVAIVTGASSDIGAGIVRRFVEEGAKVILLGRNLESLEKVRKDVGNEKNTVAITCDVTDEAQIIQTVDQVMDKYGKIDILVNGAGALNDPIHFHEMSVLKYVEFRIFKKTSGSTEEALVKVIPSEIARANITI